MQTIYTFVPSPEHHFPDHPEAPARLELLELAANPAAQPFPFSIARTADVTRVHPASMLERLQSACMDGPGLIDPAPTYVTAESYDAAMLAAGASLAATRAVVSGQARNAFAIVRPPGHHAEPLHPMGFCLLNNVAIAAQDALADGLERVMVVDYDAHHGNGTEKAFWTEARAGYFSTHQENIYPGSGSLQGAPHAKGRIADFPLPARSGDKCFVRIFDEVLAPLVRAFKPGLLLVSAGFDAHWSDPLTSLGLSTSGYYAISKKLVDLADELCNGRIVFVLEGGYDPRNVANGIQAVFAALSHTSPGTSSQPLNPTDPSPYPEPDISKRIEAFKNWHSLQ